MPATKQLGSVPVRLDQVVLENPYAQPGNTPARWPQTAVAFTEPLGWGSPLRSELSDATGNVLLSLPWMPGGPLAIGGASSRLWNAVISTNRSMHIDYFDGVLWPNEKAWRLKLVFGPESGSDWQELVNFTNIALPPFGSASTNAYTNSTINTTLVIKNVTWDQGTLGIQNSPDGFGKLSLEISGNSPGQTVSIVPGETDAGQLSYEIDQNEANDTTHVHFYAVPTKATRMYLSVGLQPTRTVEFTFKPPQALGAVTNR